MKRILTLLVFASVCTGAFAYEVTESEALTAAARFLGSSAARLTVAGRNGTKATAQDAAPAYHVFNRQGGGFAIIAGDNCLQPVIGYSESGRIDLQDMPDALVMMLDDISRSVRSRRAAGQIPDSKTLKAWDDIDKGRTKAGTPVKFLATPEWAQSNPFNDACPLIGGQRTLTGCVCTALCEIMCHYGWPASGTGSVPEYTVAGGSTYGGYDLGTVYDWDHIQLLRTQQNAMMASDAVKANLAQMHKDVGMVMQAEYGLSATGAFSFNVVPYFCGRFGFNKAARIASREMYDTEAWEQLLMAEIDKGHPVFYSGVNSDQAGHAFLVDGYDDGHCFRVNFGWGGYQNGYYALSYNFSYEQVAIVDLVPDTDGTSQYAKGNIEFFPMALANGYYGFEPDGAILKGTSFKMKTGLLLGGNNGTFDGWIKLVHLDKNGTYIEDVSNARRFMLSTKSYYLTVPEFNGCQLEEDIAFGDCIALYYRNEGEDNWYPVVNGNGTSNTPYHPLTPYGSIQVEKDYKVGDPFYLTLSNMDIPYIHSLSIFDTSWNNVHISTEWRFFLNGELKKTVALNETDRYFILPEAGEWTVIATVTQANPTVKKRRLTASFTVKP